ncbi:hypothetical protein KIW84_014786 [Lathyrus oleraceus]|uniref:Uncharacterized protein n=1 Tax=Pisum sativum TaxID=3888 RepID=A0A9D5BNJ6_PEA|nr:hypothetical protein KIW84_014786 [Pisum sativum]
MGIYTLSDDLKAWCTAIYAHNTLRSKANSSGMTLRGSILIFKDSKYQYCCHEIGQSIIHVKRKNLIGQVKEDEILQALKGINDLTSSGTDGYGAKIFKATWSFTKTDVVKVVNEFFEKDQMDDTTSINLLMDAFEEFSKFIDLSVNPAKFKVYFTNVDLQTKQEIQDMTKFTEGPLPFRYLGVSLTSKKLSIINVSLLLIKLLLGLDTGSAKLLRFAGKSQLIKSVLFDVINFWMQCIPLPKKIIQNIEVVCRSFLWTRGETISRKSHVAWHNVCTPKNQRGLNIISIKE